MKKKTFTIVTYIYYFVLIISFSIYAFRVTDENWEVDFQEQKMNLLYFAILFFIAVILTSIDGAGVRDKGTTISIKTIIGGLGIAAIFLTWKILISIF
ncbi:hypothetical protein SM124_22230 [Bacillus sp. 31A1R]|uniref:DUF1345 domain-containing protein n=1 Tax=Robertmurraya mangrovi TaxID=3098077 RepID=A0ABU5J4X5_9BACI|nr:hypothetical protein [Bacillus sp. 31A1R]MDZ5474416.1 hypothetical protein [Bacillus sp. 31A1R]